MAGKPKKTAAAQKRPARPAVSCGICRSALLWVRKMTKKGGKGSMTWHCPQCDTK